MSQLFHNVRKGGIPHGESGSFGGGSVSAESDGAIHKNDPTNRETAIKTTILTNLIENVKEIQFEWHLEQQDALNLQHQQQQQINLKETTNREPKPLGLCNATSLLCTTVEAIFLHGLKDSFLRQTIAIFAGGVVDRHPEPSFWAPLLIFTHKEIIQQIQTYTQITTDVGFCRAWVRQSLNDRLLSAYLNNIRKNQLSLTPYYRSNAFIRDVEKIALAENFINGIESAVEFELPINSTLLNIWTDHPLQMSGIYIPPLRSHVIATGIDVVANSENYENIHTATMYKKCVPKPVIITEPYSPSISNSPLTVPGFLNGENPRTTFANNETNIDEMDDYNVTCLLEKMDKVDLTDTKKSSAAGNSLKSKSGWSTVFNSDNDDDDDDPQAKMPINRSKSITISTSQSSNSLLLPCDDHSYYSLLVQHQQQQQQNLAATSTADASNCSGPSKISLKDVWDRFEASLYFENYVSAGANDSDIASAVFSNIVCASGNASGGNDGDIETIITDNQKQRVNVKKDPIILNDLMNIVQDAMISINENQNFDEFNFMGYDAANFANRSKRSLVLQTFSIDDLKQLVQQTCRIANEMGIDTQCYSCHGCPNPLTIGSNSVAHVCYFTGFYYCDECISDKLFTIPARIIYNWDYRKYPVCRKVAEFLTIFNMQPFIDLKLINPSIYMAVDEMAIIQSLRIQLNFIRAYLFTCYTTIDNDFQKLLHENEHLYEHIHRYSIYDLNQIPHGQLAQKLQHAVQFGRDHISDCHLCSQKGFICEICNSAMVLYPFDLETTYHCNACGAVFHDFCLNGTCPCPKCERKRKRRPTELSIEPSATIETSATTADTATTSATITNETTTTAYKKETTDVQMGCSNFV